VCVADFRMMGTLVIDNAVESNNNIEEEGLGFFNMTTFFLKKNSSYQKIM